jgi:hypothetical protein
MMTTLLVTGRDPLGPSRRKKILLRLNDGLQPIQEKNLNKKLFYFILKQVLKYEFLLFCSD